MAVSETIHPDILPYHDSDNAVEVFELVGTIYRYPAYNMNRADFDEVRAQRGKVGTMCFRPSPVSNGCDDGNTICCQTCGMPVSIDMSNCPYCGDPIPSDSPDGFDIDDPSYNTRII